MAAGPLTPGDTDLMRDRQDRQLEEPRRKCGLAFILANTMFWQRVQAANQ